MGLVETGARVFGVEPNGDMRREMERSAPQVVGLPTTAENTWLTSRSIDLVTCAQSFHWFDFGAARREFLRILRPDGWVALVWNERLDDATPFMVGYQKALEAYCPDYANARHRERSEDDLRAFFLPFEMRVASFPNEQRLDFEGLVGRSLSSSYAPLEGEPEHAAFIGALKSLFGEFSVEGVVSFPYSTRVYYGRLVSDETE
ncbi:MAG TPA: methyltransferase domain-containing protein, partial [Fimbriimonadaceae bacterium]|nr:methyltransferase domain-containing protein [Fimbriimonadaceae bacterium]